MDSRAQIVGLRQGREEVSVLWPKTAGRGSEVHDRATVYCALSCWSSCTRRQGEGKGDSDAGTSQREEQGAPLERRICIPGARGRSAGVAMPGSARAQGLCREAALETRLRVVPSCGWPVRHTPITTLILTRGTRFLLFHATYSTIYQPRCYEMMISCG